MLFLTILSSLCLGAGSQEVQLRRPIAVVASNDSLIAGNRNSGSLSVVDIQQRQVVSEVKIGKRISCLAANAKRDVLFATDEEEHLLIILRRNRDRSVEVVEQTNVSHSPVNVVASDDGTMVSVASLWSRRVSIFHIRDFEPIIRHVIDLPFAPRVQWLSPDGKQLVVAEAFGDRLAIVQAQRGELLAIRTIFGHNIRGLAASQDEKHLLVTHQILNGHVPTRRERIFWGAVLGNVVKSIPFDDLFSPPESSKGNVWEKAVGHWSMMPLGRPSSAAGDPGSVVVNREGAAAIALSGVNQVALRKSPRQPFARITVGRRPTAVTLSPNGQTAYVANTSEDSISVVDLTSQKVAATISLGSQPDLTVAQRGEQLFYDARLSLDGWYSCHSCHTDGHTCGLINDNFGDDSFGAPKKIPTLLGVADTGPWAWNGRQSKLHDQLHKSITKTMRGEGAAANKNNIVALNAYLETLEPPPSLGGARGSLDEVAIKRGSKLFQRQGCAECHRKPTFTSPGKFDVGLRDELNNKEFNPPSLRAVSQRRTFFHDGRAKTLRDVFTKFKHEQSGSLSSKQLSDLLLFLNSL